MLYSYICSTIQAMKMILYHQIGWIMLENAANNNTFMTHLQHLLGHHSIQFHHIKHQIWYNKCSGLNLLFL